MSQTSFFRNTSTSTMPQFGQRGSGYVASRSASREPTGGGRGFGGYLPAQLNSSNVTGGVGFGRYAERPSNTSNSNHFQGMPMVGGGRGGRSASAAPGRHTPAPNTHLTNKPITNADANPDWIQEEQKLAAAPPPMVANANQMSAPAAPVPAEFVLCEDDIVKFDTDGPVVAPIPPPSTPFDNNFQSQQPMSQTDSRTTDRIYDDIPPFGSCKKAVGGGGDGGNRPPTGFSNNRSASVDHGRPSAFSRQPADQPKPWGFRSSSNAPTAIQTTTTSVAGQPASSAFKPGPVPQQIISTSSDYNKRTGVAAPRATAASTTNVANVVVSSSMAPFGRQAAAQTTSVSMFNRPAAIPSPSVKPAVATQTDAPPSYNVPIMAGAPMRAYPPSPFDGPPFLSPVVGSAAPVRPVLTVQPAAPGDYSNINVTARLNNNDEFGPRTLRVIHEHRNVPAAVNAGGPLISSSTSSSSNVSRGRLISQEMLTDLTDSLKHIVRSVEMFGDRLRAFAEAT